MKVTIIIKEEGNSEIYEKDRREFEVTSEDLKHLPDIERERVVNLMIQLIQ